MEPASPGSYIPNMKTIPLLLGLTTALLSACKEKPVPESKPVIPAGVEVSASQPKPAFTAPDTFKAALGKVIDGYSSVQKALAKDDAAQAGTAFASMHTVLHQMPKEGLDPSARAYWDSTESRIMAILHRMAPAGAIESIRDSFYDFSLVMVDVMDGFGMAGESPVYQFHCPMAKDNKGADWLQKDSILANPYFGKSMETCGQRVRRFPPT